MTAVIVIVVWLLALALAAAFTLGSILLALHGFRKATGL